MYSYKHKIKYYETDKMGVTHHSNYIRFMEEARTDFLISHGFDYAKLEEMGIISPVVSIECKYKATTTYPDEIEIFVTIEEVKAAKIRFNYIMKKADGTEMGHHFEHIIDDLYDDFDKIKSPSVYGVNKESTMQKFEL